jgi:uncharacterized protein (DUF1330 family)
MSAYLIVHRRDITDPADLKAYSDGVDETIRRFDGEVLARNDGFKVLEGGWDPGEHHNDAEPGRVTVVRFPDMDTLMSWYESDDYGKLKRIRQHSAVCDIVAVEGRS